MSDQSLVDKAVDKVLDSSELDEIIMRRITEYVIGAVATLVFQIAGVLDTGFAIIEEAVSAAGSSLFTTATMLSTGLTVMAEGWQSFLVSIAVAFGPAAPLVLLVLWTATFVALLLAIIAFGPAVSDLLGAIPVAGSVLDAVLTWVQEWAYRLIEFAGGDG
jgi:hypothetical protein